MIINIFLYKNELVYSTIYQNYNMLKRKIASPAIFLSSLTQLPLQTRTVQILVQNRQNTLLHVMKSYLNVLQLPGK